MGHSWHVQQEVELLEPVVDLAMTRTPLAGAEMKVPQDVDCSQSWALVQSNQLLLYASEL